MDTKKLIPIVVAAILLIGGIVFWLMPQEEPVQQPIESFEDKGAVETAEIISESVPEIQTNVGEEVPEVNPLDRANPYKYVNPLR
ncbi:MAG: hypothetical protein G01um101470_879 [Parcubacteria group bacterium Gr01-1014_70]|nr:MAG: hypothetical protein G01um101470_879 [Parcubacteria group bacterium Gr01-1014_70]